MPDVNRITTSHVEKQNHAVDALPPSHSVNQCFQQET